MKRSHVAFIVLIVLALLIALGSWRFTQPTVTSRSSEVRRTERTPLLGSSSPMPPPSRNIFEYAEDLGRRTSSAAPNLARRSESLAAPPLQTSPPPTVRLIGLVRRGAHLEAALGVHGIVWTARTGDAKDGYRVLDVDEERGVQLAAPDGGIVWLAPSAP